MSEAVKRYKLRRDMPATAWEFLPGEVVSAADHDRIVAELKDRNERIREHNEFLAEAPNRMGAALRAVKKALGLPIDANVLEDLAPAINALRAEVEALRKDAERYRLLRDRGATASWEEEGVEVRSHPGMLDAAVDESIDGA